MSELRVAFASLCLGAFLAGCEGQSDMSRAGQLIFQRITSIGDTGDVSRAQVTAVPYATLGVRIGSSDQGMLVLGTRSGNTLQWVGGTQFAIATRDGRILRTVGFAHNLSGLQEVSETKLSSPTGDYRYDLADANAYGVAVHCTRSVVGQERIVIIGDTHDTVHIAEDCTAPQLDWTFRNEFWLDRGSNFVWQSVQYVHPGLDAITLQALRPVG